MHSAGARAMSSAQRIMIKWLRKAILHTTSDSTMPTHKFHIGQTVFLIPALSVPGGAYVVTKRMPERDGEFQYRVKSVNEPHERVVRESEMSDVP